MKPKPPAKKKPLHPWRVVNPLNPPRNDEKVVPYAARMGLKAR